MKALIAEDDQFLLKVYETKLAKEGFEVVSAINGEEAVRGALESNPDIILLDLIMPIKNGFEVLEELKNHPEFAQTPIIVLSNLGQDNDTKKAMELGATDYIVKSNSSIDEIVKTIIKLLNTQ